MASPLKAILSVRRRELPLALLMFSYFFLVITSFWILKPIKKALFIGYYTTAGGLDLLGTHLAGSQAEQIAKVMNMVVAFVAVTVFTLLARRFRRQHLTYIFSGFFMVAYAAYAAVINSPSEVTVWSFYLFGDLFSTLMVATFFAFLNDSVTPDAAKRLYGLVGLGGVTGGVFGSTIVRTGIESLSSSQWLWVCFGVGGAIVVSAAGASRLLGRSTELGRAAEERPSDAAAPEPRKGNAALEGARLVFRSSYLTAIVLIVGLYEMCSTIMDFQFTASIEHYVTDPAMQGVVFSTVFTITNITSLVVQLFLTSFIMTRFGIATALLVLPITMLLGSAGFLAVPALFMGRFLNTADNGFSYSINQSAKEALYVPTSRDEKYKAKAFIDMFVQRFAKALAVVLNLWISTAFAAFSGVRWLSLFTVAILVVWILAARYAGRKFNDLSESGGASA